MSDTITVRAGSQEPVDFDLKHDTNNDGIVDAAVDLTGVTRVELHLRRLSDQTVTIHSTTDPSAKLTITAPATNGRVRFSPGAGDWVATHVGYDGWFLIIDAAGKNIPVAEYKEFQIMVRPSF